MALRISTEESAATITIILEGRIVGPWADELGRTWSSLASSIGSRSVSIDLRNATYADANGVRVLREIHSQSPVKFITSTPWTEYLAQEVTRALGNQQ